ncbi:MAG: AAA family ATPase [bacterium]|nr:AAA family ATPase [bacterium]
MSTERLPAGLDAAMAHVAEPDEVYTTRDALDILSDDRPQPEEIWGGLQLVPGQIMEIIGGSGLGKSRIVLNLALNQVLGRPFAGLPTLQRPLTWLFYGNENSFYRFRHDLSKMTSVLNTAECERLRGHVWLPTMEKAADAFVSFSDPVNRERLKATMRLRRPDVLVLDPWGAFIDGDELNDGDVRRTITDIVEILAANPDKPAVAIVLNHSRNGLREMIDAAGAGKANYGKNSKAIYSVVRCVWNLRPAHFDEPVTKIELLHAKSSDIRPYPPVAIELNPNTFHYLVDPTFNHEVWQAALEKAYRSGGSTLTAEDRNKVRLQRESEEKDLVKAYVANVSSVSRKVLGEWARGKGIAENRMRQIVSELHQEGSVAILCDKGNSRMVCTPSAAIAKMTEGAPDAYRLLPRPSTARQSCAVPHEAGDE